MRTNHRAQRMYRSLGFREVDLRSDEFERLANLVGGVDDDVIVMRLNGAGLKPQSRYEVHLA